MSNFFWIFLPASSWTRNTAFHAYKEFLNLVQISETVRYFQKGYNYSKQIIFLEVVKHFNVSVLCDLLRFNELKN